MRTDVKSQIDQLNAELGAMPMSRREYAEKRATDSAMAFSDKASAFGEGVWDGMKILGGQAVDAGGELVGKAGKAGAKLTAKAVKGIAKGATTDIRLPPVKAL